MNFEDNNLRILFNIKNSFKSLKENIYRMVERYDSITKLQNKDFTFPAKLKYGTCVRNKNKISENLIDVEITEDAIAKFYQDVRNYCEKRKDYLKEYYDSIDVFSKFLIENQDIKKYAMLNKNEYLYRLILLWKGEIFKNVETYEAIKKEAENILKSIKDIDTEIVNLTF